MCLSKCNLQIDFSESYLMHFHDLQTAFFHLKIPHPFSCRYALSSIKKMPADALKAVQLAELVGSMTVFTYSTSIVMIIIAIVALIIGAVFHGQCAIEPNISIYLIVQGIIVMIVFLIILISVSTLLNTISIGTLLSFIT